MPLRAMVGLLSSAFNIQPAKLTGFEPGLYNSIHSSDEDAAVPAQATSFIRIRRNPTDVDVIVVVLVRFTAPVLVRFAAAVLVRFDATVPVRFATAVAVNMAPQVITGVNALLRGVG